MPLIAVSALLNEENCLLPRKIMRANFEAWRDKLVNRTMLAN